MTYHRFVTRVKQRVPLVEQELLILLGHLIAPPILVGCVSLDGPKLDSQSQLGAPSLIEVNLSLNNNYLLYTMSSC